jgi:hypothetical protein
MQIFNVRLGLATNSSSSHSLIFINDMEVRDFSGYRRHIIDGTVQEIGKTDFGWNHFTLASAEAKMRYLAVLLRDRLTSNLPYNISAMVIREWLSEDAANSTIGDHIDDSHIDHQSWFFLPSEFGTNIPDEQFFKELKDYFLQENLVILGGNDNDDVAHPYDDGTSFQLPLPYDISPKDNCVCRKDEDNNYWTIFWPESGAKLRFRLENGKSDWEDFPKKASAPELIDIKITDFCPFGCEFCYQSSTIKGNHCDSVWELAQACKELKVFEVALGGGEPTLHPNFVHILRTFREKGVVPNFTTRNLSWLKDPKEKEEIMQYAGAFAYSIDDANDIKELVRIVDYVNLEHSRVHLHVVMGTVESWQFDHIIKEAYEHNFQVTLLGWKNVGFGENYNKKDYSWWLGSLMNKAHPIGRIAIDTVLAAEFNNELQASDVPRILYHTEDGKFSCYIDWVKKKMGPSSYEPDKMQSLSMQSELSSEISRIFSSF